MSNTLTSLIPDLYEDLDVVSREIVGMIPAVNRDSSAERAALNQTIRTFVAPASTAADIVPAQLAPNTGDQTIGNVTLSISKSRAVPIRWNGEEQRGLDSNGPGYLNVRRNQFRQAFRTLVNEMETDGCKLFSSASRAIKPSGTHLFDAANYKDIANARRILVENGAPMNDISLVLNPLEGAAFRGNAQYYSQYASGLPADFLAQGILMNIHGVKIKESQQIQNFTVGTGANYVVNAVGGLAVGTTTIPADVGTGTILAGDVVTLQGDSNHYVVTSALSAGSFKIAAPGLKVAHADEDTITIETPTERNIMFARNAITLVTRAPMRPTEGDNALDVATIEDPNSGISFEVAMYKEYRQVHYEVSAAWGWAMTKPEHSCLLIDN